VIITEVMLLWPCSDFVTEVEGITREGNFSCRTRCDQNCNPMSPDAEA
jgi:hypothetical protein